MSRLGHDAGHPMGGTAGEQNERRKGEGERKEEIGGLTLGA